MNEEQKSPTTIADLELRIDSLIGQAAAFSVLVTAIIETHPDPAALSKQIHRLTEMGTAALLPSSGSDAIVQAFQIVAARAQVHADERAQEHGQ